MDDYALYGHSLFETFTVHNGMVRNLAHHYQRLAQSARHIGMDPPDAAAFCAALQQKVPSQGDWVVRFTLLKQGGRWADTPEPRTTWQVWTRPFRGDPRPSLSLHLGHHRFPVNDVWRRLKSGSRLGYQIVGREAKAAGFDDGLIVDDGGNLLETGIANLFVLPPHGTWTTPPLASGLLPGTVRRQVLEQGAAVEGTLNLAQLPFFQAVVVSNAVTTLKPIHRIMNHAYSLEPAKAWIQAFAPAEPQPLDRFLDSLRD